MADRQISSRLYIRDAKPSFCSIKIIIKRSPVMSLSIFFHRQFPYYKKKKNYKFSEPTSKQVRNLLLNKKRMSYGIISTVSG